MGRLLHMKNSVGLENRFTNITRSRVLYSWDGLSSEIQASNTEYGGDSSALSIFEKDVAKVNQKNVHKEEEATLF